ncbi:hypothetical protein GUJ93_ZPchr0010g10405 [Zizania palustris]|uniref:Oxidoreductase FAD/NAD(P)-binding domain-containing protein n=1 Tax=Zizania palustris TaxID=103762 RepID=A0A8J5WFQ2_ZIZPA|nr:hypothetical protein GUJ93_ZPchr0010g10405 [Zizania palustris]
MDIDDRSLGPLGHVDYTGRGNFTINDKPRHARLRERYQVIQTEDKTEMHLVYANRTEDDILLGDELDRWAAEYPDRPAQRCGTSSTR